MKARNLVIRYSVSTLGLLLVAFGVALSLKSNLGTAPPSCPPAVLNLRWGALSVGTLTWMLHLVLIAAQMAMLRRVLDANYLLQILAAFVFGYLCDAGIWLLRDVVAETYWVRMVYCLVAVLITAVGIRLEVLGNTWMLAGDRFVMVFAKVTGIRFSLAKVIVDMLFVAASSLFAWFAFRSFFGDGASVVIREGTFVLAFLTGLCMQLTDPLVDKVFKPLLREQG